MPAVASGGSRSQALSAACLRQAREELNEIESDRLSAVEALKKWVEKQENLRCRTGTVKYGFLAQSLATFY